MVENMVKYAGGRLAVAERIRDCGELVVIVLIGEERIKFGENLCLVGADEASGAGSDCLGALGLLT